MTDIGQSYRLTDGTQVQAEAGSSRNKSDEGPWQASDSIPLEQTTCYARSFGNPHSRLFWWNRKLFCGLLGSQAKLIHELETTGIIRQLTRKKLVAHAEPAEIAVEGFDSIRQIVPTPRVSYVFEWCPAMWRDAAHTLINILAELLPFNLTIKNPHSWNVLFYGCQPVYIDIGSIVPLKGETFWRAYEKLCRFLVHPLLLNAMGHGVIARSMLHDVHVGIRSEEFPILASFTSRLRKKYDKSEPRQFLEGLQKAIEDIEIPDQQTKWTGYHGVTSRELSEQTSKDRTLHRVLSDLRPCSLLDIGCNEGRYSRLAERLGSEVTAVDADETCINRLYNFSRTQNNNILPAVIDFTNPSPGYGVANRWFPPVTDRFASEVVLGLAIEHHFVFGRYRLTFDEVVRGFASFSRRWLIVEFIPSGADTNANPIDWRPESAVWYNIESFVAALRKEFGAVTKLPHTNGDRILLLCEKSR